MTLGLETVYFSAAGCFDWCLVGCYFALAGWVLLFVWVVCLQFEFFVLDVDVCVLCGLFMVLSSN